MLPARRDSIPAVSLSSINDKRSHVHHLCQFRQDSKTSTRNTVQPSVASSLVREEPPLRSCDGGNYSRTVAPCALHAGLMHAAAVLETLQGGCHCSRVQTRSAQPWSPASLRRAGLAEEMNLTRFDPALSSPPNAHHRPAGGSGDDGGHRLALLGSGSRPCLNSDAAWILGRALLTAKRTARVRSTVGSEQGEERLITILLLTIDRSKSCRQLTTTMDMTAGTC